MKGENILKHSSGVETEGSRMEREKIL